MADLPSPLTVLAVGFFLGVFAAVGIWVGSLMPLFIRWCK